MGATQGDREIAATLASTIIFADVPESDLLALAPLAQANDFAHGETIMHRGDAADRFFIIERGSARVLLRDVGGDDVVLHEVTAGEHFGEVALIDGKPRSADVVAGESGCRTISIGRQDFLRLTEAHPRVAGQLVTFLRHELRQGVHGEAPADYEDIAGRLTQAIDALARDEGRAEPVVELLPLQLRAGELQWFRPAGQASWQTRCDGRQYPGDLLLTLLRDAGAAADILHSTSWRYQDDHLVLTYVAVLPPTASMPHELVAEGVRRADLARGAAAAPPETIGVAQVVEHGLRHLAWLLNDDPVVRDRLSPDWAALLEAYEPEPFRALVENDHRPV